uniref:Guanine nucleotide-releasing factor 2 n=1 Tax=Cacopsylla melanoneura TaxID=428564 RepID=A0A8D8PPW0_9HEMI
MEPYQENNKHKDRNIFNDRNDKCHKNKPGNRMKSFLPNLFHTRSATLKPPCRTPAKEKVMTTPDEGFKAVKNALKHFLTVIGNNKLEVLPVLPGNGTIILESVSKVHELVTAGPGLNCHSSNVQSTLSHVYQSVANLIKFCDDYALYNSNNAPYHNENEEVNEEAKQQIAAEFKKVVREAESCVREVSEAMKSLEQLVPSNSRWFQTSLPEINSEQDTDMNNHLESSYVYRRNKSLECLGVYSSTTPSPPSKPPYERNSSEHPPAAPPVPPKKRNLYVETISNNNNNAFSMERLSLGSQGESDFSSLQEYDYRDSLDGTNSPHLNRSTQYSYSSSHSSSSQHFIINSSSTQSTLNSVVNQQFNMNQHMSSGSSVMLESWELTPPPLPKKERSSGRQRHDSQYDNVPELNCDSDFESDVPPPLPPKKRHISDYMKVFGPSRLESFLSDPTCVRDMFLHQQSHHMTQHSLWAYNSTVSFQSDFQTQSTCSRSIDTSFGYDEDVINRDSIDPHAPPLPPKTRNPPGSNVYSNQNSYVPEEDNQIICRPDKTNQQDKLSVADNKALLENLPECTIDFIKKLDVRDHLIFTEDGNDVRGAHPDALLVHATRDNNKHLFQDIYLTTYRTFTTPLDIIIKLIDRYNTFIISAEVQNQRAANETFSFLKRVVSELTIHELETNLVKLLKDFIYKLLSIGRIDAGKNLRQILLEKYACKNRESRINPLLTSLNVTTSQKTLLDFKPEALAETMTLLDSELFVKIEIPEVLSWIEQQSPEQQDEEKSPNLMKFTKHFNNVSYWARTQILNQRPAALRESYITKFIKIMDHLKTLNNFNSYLALVAALSSAPIKRLQSYKNKNITVSDMVTSYSALIDSTSSFKAYRQTLADAKPPCIPYIGLVLQDLTFVQIGNAKLLTYKELPAHIQYKNVINFSMRQYQFKILQNMRRFQSDRHDFRRQDRIEIIELFDDFEDFLQEESMWGLSEQIQPRKPAQHSN